VGTPFGYDNGVDEDGKQEPTWTTLIKDAAKEFVTNLADSSKQLATAAEKLAADSLHALEDATNKVQTSATTSNDMATAAKEAAAEAQRIADSLSQSISEAMEKAREEAQTAVQEALRSQADHAAEGANELKADMEQRLTEMGRRLDESLMRFESSIEANQTASDQAKEAFASRQQAESDIEQRVEAAIERLEAIANANQDAIATARQAADSALQAANEAKEQVSRIEESNSPSLGVSAQEVLERLEADYQLLAQLVTELHSRIASLNEPSSIPEASTSTSEPVDEAIPSPIMTPWGSQETKSEPALEPWQAKEAKSEPALEPWQAEEAKSEPALEPWRAEQPEAEPAMPSWDTQEPATEPAMPSWSPEEPKAERPAEETPSWVRDLMSVPQVSEPQVEPETRATEPASWPMPSREWTPEYSTDSTAEPASPMPAADVRVSGRVMVKLSPVPDFDRLLNLDGALGRLAGVRNVTLADYAQEEVTFKIELDNAMTPEDFCQRLGESVGSSVSIVTAAPDSMTLRLN
jgi:hypothetical protein